MPMSCEEMVPEFIYELPDGDLLNMLDPETAAQHPNTGWSYPVA